MSTNNATQQHEDFCCFLPWKMLDLKQECYLKCIWPYFDRQGVCNFFGIRLRYCPFSERSFVSPYFTTRAYNRCYFLGNFLMEVSTFFALSDILEMSLSTNCLLWFPKKGPPTKAKRAHRNTRKGKDIKRSNETFFILRGG